MSPKQSPFEDSPASSCELVRRSIRFLFDMVRLPVDLVKAGVVFRRMKK